MAEQNLSPQQIGASFVTQYYHTLAKEPEVLYKFYKDNSSISYGSENESSIAPIAGLESIQAKITSLDYIDCKVKLSVVDSLRSLSGAILVVVLGYLSIAGKAYKKFSQAFVLAEQTPKGYYVMNDVFRYLSDAAPPQISSAPKKQPSAAQQSVTITTTPPISAQNTTTSSSHIITTIPTSLTQHAPTAASQFYHDNLSDGAPSEADSTAATAGTSVIGVEDSMVLSDSEGLDSSHNHKKPKSTGAKSTTSVSSLSTSSSKSEKTAKEQPKENADGKADASSVPAAPPQQPQPTLQEKLVLPKRIKKQAQSPSAETKLQSPAETTTPAAAPTASQKKNDGPKSYAAAVGGDDYVEPPTPTSPIDHKQHYDGRNKKNTPNGVFVSKLHPQTAMADLENAFSKYGKITFIKNKAKEHYAFVYFETAEASEAAIADSDKLQIARHTVRVEKRTDKPYYQKTRGGASRRGGFIRRGSSEDRSDHGAPRVRGKFFRGRGRGKPAMNGQTNNAAAATTKDQ